ARSAAPRIECDSLLILARDQSSCFVDPAASPDVAFGCRERPVIPILAHPVAGCSESAVSTEVSVGDCGEMPGNGDRASGGPLMRQLAVQLCGVELVRNVAEHDWKAARIQQSRCVCVDVDEVVRLNIE